MNGFTYEDYKVAEATKELQQEIDRLNNIIEELEKDIKSHYIVGHNIVNPILDSILGRLKELKENNK